MSGGYFTVNASGFIRPIAGGIITSPFGNRVDPITGEVSLHAGDDISCTDGQPIYSAKDGTVERAGWENPSNHSQGYGQRIYVDHGGGQETVYGHLSQILVQPGQQIKQGQIIGKCGSTGSSTGYHLHIEIHVNGNKVDPLPYIQG